MGLLAEPPAYVGYQPVNSDLATKRADIEQSNIEQQNVDLERNQKDRRDRDEDECCMTTRMCLPYLYRLSMAAIVGGTIFGVAYLVTKPSWMVRSKVH